MAQNYETISIEKTKPVLRVTFNRSEKANAMNAQMNEELDRILTEVRNDSDYKFIVFTGNGRVFSGGADMNEVLNELKDNPLSSSWVREDQLQRQEFSRKLDTLDQITIAAINGPAYGAGLALAI